MKIYKKLFIISILSMVFLQNLWAKAPQAVSSVDAKKFSGLWYEIGRTYNSFQKNCVASSVEYILTKPLEYEIKNRCFDTKIGGDLIEYSGVGKSSDGKSMSKIDMTYFWIFTKQYRVIYIDKNYTSAVVVDKNMEHVWIMDRKPFMDKKRLKNIVTMLSNYMDISKLIYTPQDKKGKYK